MTAPRVLLAPSARRARGRPWSSALARLERADCALFDRVARSRTPRLDVAMPALSRAANHSKLWGAVAALLAARGGRLGQRAALRGLGSVAVTSLLVNQGVKQVVRRPRPSLRGVPAVRRLRTQPLTTSFPSGHSASAFAFAAGAGFELPRVAPPLAAAAAAVAYSRVHTGVHYPADVVVGAAAGAGIALLSRLPWPTVPREPEAARPSADRRLLPQAANGEGLALVVNHDAGPAFAGEPLAEIRSLLPRAEVLEVTAGDELPATLRRAVERCAVLGICGGDGSVSAAAQEALAHGKPLLLVPAGTLNHLARDLRLRSAGDALDAFRSGEAVAVDVAVIDGRPYLSMASFGAYTEIVDVRRSLETRLGRWPAYAVALLKVLLAAEPATLRVDGSERRLWMVFAGNCRYEPAGFAPGWRRRLDDGVLDVRLIDAAPPLARLRTALAIVTGRLAKCRAYDRWSARELRIESPARSLRLARDGETFDGSGSFRVEKLAERLVIYAPHAG